MKYSTFFGRTYTKIGTIQRRYMKYRNKRKRKHLDKNK